MEYRDWLIIKVLFEEKNITKTANSLFISQPVLTVRLRQIEEEFGVKIVHRGNKGVFFTPEGEYLAHCAESALADLHKIKERVANIGSEMTGTLRLGASNYVTKYQLPCLLKLFKDKYPNVELKVTTSWSKDILNLVYNQEIHVGFVRGDYSWRDEKVLLFTEPICLASMDEIHLKDLPNLPKIDYRTENTIQTLLDNWWRENYSRPPLISMTVNNVDTCKEMVINGLGYAILPDRIVNEIPGIYKIYIRDKKGIHVLRNTWMHFQKESLETKIIHAFVNFVKGYKF
ncbi:LysR family transcriptional regulator [Pelosinus sp. sgz500959]|uniref:LysR family transcriptional regulator n=1 Tax=Pelosinus sp. sgz500959 TaxID=3242472 RepID=UPI00366D1EA2